MADVILCSAGNTEFKKPLKRNFLTEYYFEILSIVFVSLLGVLISKIIAIQLFWGFVVAAILALCFVTIVVLLCK